MKRILLLGLILLFTTSLIYGQGRKRKKKKGQKIYISTFINTDLNQSLSYGESSIKSDPVDNFGTTVPGLQRNIRSESETIGIGFSIQKVQKNNKYTEFSISKFRLQQDESVQWRFLEVGNIIEPTSGKRNTNFETAFRYEYGTYFYLSDESKLRFGIAGGLAPYFGYNKTLPATSASFPVRYLRYGLKLEFVPSISYRCSKKGFLDFKWSPSIFDFNRHNVKTDNPILTERQRKKAYSIPSFLQTSLSFQLHYRHQILGKRDSKKAFRKKKNKKSDDGEINKKAKKKSAIYVNPIINIYSGGEDLSHQFSYSRGEVDTLANFIKHEPYINGGIGVQFVKESGFYNEFSLTRFTRKQTFSKIVNRFAEVPNFSLPPEISESQSHSNSFAGRYEFGKIFGDPIRSKILFSIGLGLEGFYRGHNWEEGTQVSNSGAALKIIPALSFKLSHRFNLHLRWTPSVYSGYYQTFNFVEDPNYLPIENKTWYFESLPNLGNCSVGFRVRVF